MKNRNGRLMSLADFRAELARAPNTLFAVAGDERLLAQLPQGNWIGGDNPFLMTHQGGGLPTRPPPMVDERVAEQRAAPPNHGFDPDTNPPAPPEPPAN